ncbi:YgdI/YgdR family lipoprotein [Pseudomonas sp. CFBP 8770]|uniref:YgdI/YgdR family lipoprotein n=1 Tax=unclassified Pseudomonas TaxID=196821 RepID=UPI000F048D8D|nr:MULTISPECIES: YgdI/YgdR family lipoprotein [unclassified Pseudomonas]MBD8473419.1 YgdI/YgdR family lipoprotein [Pseudomonas sp. CFBP 8773]MBD8646546.1 YgdI/YgdR family lipoprotein [Pseudomonas sp. CFBP 8770]
MKLKAVYYCTAFLCAATLAGCSTNTVVTLQDGTQYITKDVPDAKTKDGFYEFEDVSGKQVRVKADEVATVKEED